MYRYSYYKCEFMLVVVWLMCSSVIATACVYVCVVSMYGAVHWQLPPLADLPLSLMIFLFLLILFSYILLILYDV